MKNKQPGFLFAEAMIAMIISLLAIQTLASVLAGVTIAQAKSEQMSDQAFAKYLFRHTSLTQIKLHDKVYSQ